MECSEELERVDRFLEYLAMDKGWHTLEECARVLGVGLDTGREVVRLLASIGFVDYDEGRGVVRINPDLAGFIVESL
ncbi:hypothetical protein DRO58_01120 [Candidatus Bathyarchaeota archaeon]|nr:MAG: hypothetical protein DRO58_01120 [Candidatus Bathyarchaeota archaeon]